MPALAVHDKREKMVVYIVRLWRLIGGWVGLVQCNVVLPPQSGRVGEVEGSQVCYTPSPYQELHLMLFISIMLADVTSPPS